MADEKHACSECGRTYGSRGTLRRHQRNHEASAGDYTCNLCGVQFNRRDLLVRHRARLHNRESCPEVRQRCHTACDDCRIARVRCDGFDPCGNCARRQKRCGYSDRPAGRRSRRQHWPSSWGQGIPTSDGGLSDFTTTTTTLHCEPADERTISPARHLLSTSIAEAIMIDETLIQMQTPFTDNLSTSSFWPFSTSWLWQYEGPYLLSPRSTRGEDQELLIDVQLDPVGGDRYPSIPTGAQVESNPNAGRHSPLPTSLKLVIHDMVESAMSPIPHSIDWTSYSKQISPFMSEQDALHSAPDRHVFDEFVDQYFHHFHPMWALVDKQPDLQAKLQPLLYLSITSIGALYSISQNAVDYGSILHKKLRDVLIRHAFTGQTEAEALDTGRAMLLTQMANLYFFEQNEALLAAQRLSATLYAHSHRMRLFTTKETQHIGSYATKEDYQNDVLLDQGRKMLAFGLFRAEAFMSILFNTKPSVSYEEINLTLLEAPDLTCVLDSELTHSSDRGCSAHLDQLFFSDLVRIALDKDEILPVLGPADAEALLFGLQHEIWRFSHDPKLFLRLLKQQRPSSDTHLEVAFVFDHLNYPSRKMQTLVDDYQRLVQALHKWKQAMSQIQISNTLSTHNRTTYLSGLVLYDLSFLRLTAPLERIQQMAHLLHSPSTSSKELMQEVRDWAGTSEAVEAVHYARSIWFRLNLEAQRPRELQARYIVLMLIALYHAAVVIWAIAGADVHPQQRLLDDCAETTLEHVNTKHLMTKFEELFPKLTASWGLKSSFAKMVRDLAEYPLLCSYDDGPWTSVV